MNEPHSHEEHEHPHDHAHNHEHRTTSHGQDKKFFLEDLLAKLRIMKVSRHIPHNSIVCDIGCGYRGLFLFAKQNTFSKGYGFDIAVDESKNTEKIILKPADLNEHIPLPDESVERVTSLAVLEHLSNREKHLAEIFRILRKGGKLLLTTPTPKNKPLLEFLAFRLKVTDATEIADHKCYLTGNDLKTMLIKAGFAPEKIHATTWQLGLNNFVIAEK